MINFNNLLGLFNFSKNLKTILIWATVVLIVLFILKYKNGRIIILTCFVVAFVGFTIYAGLYVNRYYKADGGIYGQIVKLYNPNQVKITDNIKYSFKNVVLTQELDNKYSARMTSDDVLDLVLDENATYGVYVNGVPCQNCTITEEFVLADYEYVFYNDDFSIAMQDTLSFRFAFYSNSTLLIISTNGGASAVKYWNYYFNKNLFEVTIDNKGFDYSATNDISPAEPIYNRPLTINLGESSIDDENLKFTVTVDGTVYQNIHSWSGFVDRKSKVLISNFENWGIVEKLTIGNLTYTTRTYISGAHAENCKNVSTSDSIFVITNFNDLENNSITFATLTIFVDDDSTSSGGGSGGGSGGSGGNSW